MNPSVSSNVIGPFRADDWFALRQIKASVRWMKEKNAVRYRLQIDKEREIFKDILKEYIPEVPYYYEPTKHIPEEAA